MKWISAGVSKMAFRNNKKFVQWVKKSKRIIYDMIIYLFDSK